MPEYPELDVLPEWPTRTIAVLATVDYGPHLVGQENDLAGELRLIGTV